MGKPKHEATLTELAAPPSAKKRRGSHKLVRTKGQKRDRLQFASTAIRKQPRLY